MKVHRNKYLECDGDLSWFGVAFEVRLCRLLFYKYFTQNQNYAILFFEFQYLKKKATHVRTIKKI